MRASSRVGLRQAGWTASSTAATAVGWKSGRPPHGVTTAAARTAAASSLVGAGHWSSMVWDTKVTRRRSRRSRARADTWVRAASAWSVRSATRVSSASGAAVGMSSSSRVRSTRQSTHTGWKASAQSRRVIPVIRVQVGHTHGGVFSSHPPECFAFVPVTAVG